jgi:hypothetical protein
LLRPPVLYNRGDLGARMPGEYNYLVFLPSFFLLGCYGSS